MADKLNKIAVGGFQIAVSKGKEAKGDGEHVNPVIAEVAAGRHVLVTPKQAEAMGDLLRDPSKEEGKGVEFLDLTGVADKAVPEAPAAGNVAAAAKAS